ncbi:MAG: OsmC family protein [Verrucomicrobiota bacterium]
MVTIQLTYQGGLRCSATHLSSGNTLSTDAPVDNNGKGESFSPTDLLATGLGACMATVMGIVAERKQISLDGLKVEVRKHMSTDTPRRIAKLEVDIDMPLAADHPERALLESAGRGCPAHHSLHPDIETIFNWTWK